MRIWPKKSIQVIVVTDGKNVLGQEGSWLPVWCYICLVILAFSGFMYASGFFLVHSELLSILNHSFKFIYNIVLAYLVSESLSNECLS
jgi:hypothetical protein